MESLADLEMMNTIERRMVVYSAERQLPIYGTLELLPLCNMSCSMCYVRQTPAQVEVSGGLLSISQWLHIAEEMQKAGVLFLLLTGGEPLLYPGFKELYLSLRRMGMILTINSNGTLLDEEWISFFSEYKPRRINITLYGKDEESYEKLCHYREGFQKALTAIRKLKEQGIAVKINGSATASNVDDMDGIYELGRELDVPVHFDTYMIPPVNHQNEISRSRLSPERAAEASLLAMEHEYSEEYLRGYIAHVVDMVTNYHGDASDRISCLAGNCSFAIDWKGNMRPCVSMLKPDSNVFENGFKEAWMKIAQESKTLHMNQKCVACRLRPLCQVCVASAFLETGSYDGIPDYLCRYTEYYYRLLTTSYASHEDTSVSRHS